MSSQALAIEITADAIRIGERFAVTFQRTLRVPDDGKTYPLPPGLGRLPVVPLSRFAERLPAAWRERDGAMIPLYQREALWLGFHAARWKPNAVKVAVGGINAISGDHHDDRLRGNPQDYMVCPPQFWLDGIHTRGGSVRQFVAMPLGEGYTVEASLTGSETVGGLQISVFEPKPGRFPDQPPPSLDRGPDRMSSPGGGAAMGLGAGGTIRQKIYPDPYPLDTWDPDHRGTVFVHILNAAQYRAITEQAPPPSPVDAALYTRHGLPWFELYDDSLADVPPSDALQGATTIAERDVERGIPPASESFDIATGQIETVRHPEQRGPPRQRSRKRP